MLSELPCPLQRQIDAARPRSVETVQANVGAGPAAGDACRVVEAAVVQIASAGTGSKSGSHAGRAQDSRIRMAGAILRNGTDHPVRKQSFGDTGAGVLGLIDDRRQHLMTLIEQIRAFGIGIAPLVVEIEAVAGNVMRERVSERKAEP